jgi:glucosamine-6-phosphate deaminase
MKLVISKDADHCAAMVAHILEGQIKQKAESWIALPYSPSFKRVYDYLVEAHQNKEVDFSRAHFIGTSEVVRCSHCLSIKDQLTARFFAPCGIDEDHIHCFDPDDLSNAAGVFNQFLDMIPPLDLILTSAGTDGHIANNSAADALSARIHFDTITESTRQTLVVDYDDLSEVPTQILTFGIQDLLRAKKLLIMASGRNKSSVVKTLLNTKKISTGFPVSMMLLHDNCILAVDADAASEADIQMPTFE